MKFSPAIAVCFTLNYVIGSALGDENEMLNVRAWQSHSDYPTSRDFPEHGLLDDRSNSAIAFSGGGSRAFVASMGYLAGLQELGLMESVRYVGGVSGGAWAATSYTYKQNAEVSDEVYLGPIVDPEDITYDGLQVMDKDCARGFADVPLVPWVLEAFANGTAEDLAGAWCWAVHQAYLAPTGVPLATRFSWNEASVADIKARNPSLANERFVLPAQGRPFSLTSAILIGPVEGAPYKPKTQNYTHIDFTPLYIGQMFAQDVAYGYHHQLTGDKPKAKRVGGVAEPFGVARHGQVPKAGLRAKEASGELQVPAPDTIMDLAFAAGASGYAPGAFFDSLAGPLPEKLGLNMNYWSPTLRDPDSEQDKRSDDWLYGDGGSYENINLINFIQRGVEKIVLFMLNGDPLLPAQDWDVYTDPFSEGQISKSVPAFFGILAADGTEPKWENRSYELRTDQVFAQEDYAPLITAMQAAQAKGKGIVVTQVLQTVENTWWGIPANRTVEVTWVYMSRLFEWEARLSPEMQALVVPPGAAALDASETIQDGPFRKFPHYPTSGGGVNPERANLLADLTGWTVRQNKEVFERMLSKKE